MQINRTKSLDEFNKFLETKLYTKPYGVEKSRIQGHTKTQTATYIVLALFAATIALCYFLQVRSLEYYAVIAILYYLWFIKTRSFKDQYAFGCQEEIVREIIAFANPNFQYEPKHYIPEDHFIAAHLFRIAHDVYRGRYYASGMLDETSVEFSEVSSLSNLGSYPGQSLPHHYLHPIGNLLNRMQ